MLKKVIIAMFIILITIIGICFGMLIRINNSEKFESNNTKNTNITNENRPIVYDAETYKKANKIMEVDNYYQGKYELNTDKDIIVPIINIKSDYADEVNKELLDLYEEAYANFKILSASQSTDGMHEAYDYSTLSYKFFENQNVLSVVVYKTDGIVQYKKEPVDNYKSMKFERNKYIYTYNFNLETNEKANIDTMAKIAGFSSGKQVLDKIEEWEESQKKILSEQENAAQYLKMFKGAQKDQFFLSAGGDLYFIARVSNNLYDNDTTMSLNPKYEIKSLIEFKKDD